MDPTNQEQPENAYDFLEPAMPELDEGPDENLPDRRSGARHGKRGLFNRGRRVHRVRPVHIFLWSLTCVLSLTGIAVITYAGRAVFWLASLPVLIVAFFGSLIVLALYMARPR